MRRPYKDGTITAFEVKSGSNYLAHAALDNALGNGNCDITDAYVLAETNVKVDGRVTYLPVYMAALFNYDE